MTDNPYVLLTKVLDQSIAQIIRGALETHDITCMVHDTHPAALGIGIMNIGIMVLKNDLERAKQILEEIGDEA